MSNWNHWSPDDAATPDAEPSISPNAHSSAGLGEGGAPGAAVGASNHAARNILAVTCVVLVGLLGGVTYRSMTAERSRDDGATAATTTAWPPATSPTSVTAALDSSPSSTATATSRLTVPSPTAMPSSSDPWSRTYTDDRKFSFEMPGSPDVQAGDVPQHPGNMHWAGYDLLTSEERFTLTVFDFVDVPGASLQANPDSNLDAAVKATR